MNLQEHLALIGHDASLFAFKAKVPQSVIENVLAGKPIPAVHATKIAQQLSNEHGMPKKQGFDVSDIDGLQVIHPDELRN